MIGNTPLVVSVRLLPEETSKEEKTFGDADSPIIIAFRRKQFKRSKKVEKAPYECSHCYSPSLRSSSLSSKMDKPVG